MKTLIKHHYNNHKETIHNFIWRSLQIFGKQGTTFLIFILCAKLLNPYDFGIYNYVLAVIFFLIMFGDFGISTATSKYVTEYNVIDKEKLRGVLFNSGIIILGLTIIVTILTLVIGPSYFKDKYVYVLYLLPLVFLAPITSLYDGIYRGLKKFKKLAIISLIVGFISLFFVFFLIQSYGLIGAIISQNISCIILLFGLGFGYRDFNFKINKEVMNEIGRYSFMIGIATTGYFLFSRITILILGKYNYITEIATYEMLNKLSALILIPFMIVASVIAPNIAIYYAQKDYKKLYSKFKKYFVIFLILSAIISILCLFLFPIIIKIFFHNYYNEIFYKILFPVLVLQLVLVYSSIINNLIILSTVFARIDMYLKLLLALINIPLSLILINHIGYIGPIYSSVFITLIEIIFLHVSYFRYIKFKSV